MAKSRETQDEEIIVEEVVGDKKGFLDNSQMTIIGGAAVFLLLIGAYLAYKYLYQAPREKAAVEQIFKAEQQFQQDSFALALEAPGGGYDGLLDIIDSYGGTKTANLAKYYAGISYLNLGRFEDAVSYLNAHNEKGAITSITKYGALGDAYSELGEYDKAISAYSKASSGDTDVLVPYYLYKLGLLAQKQGQADKAKKAFDRLAADFPDSAEAAEAQKYIGLLK